MMARAQIQQPTLKESVMSLPRSASTALLVLFMTGCGTTGTTLTCDKPTCSVAVEGTGFGGYRVKPDSVYAVPPQSHIVVWGFSAQNGSFSTQSSPPDGIVVKDVPDLSTIGISDCRPSKDPDGAGEDAVGPYYRCKIRGKAAPFGRDYQLFFHDQTGQQRSLDPYVTNSGGPANGSSPGPGRALTKSASGPIVRIALASSASPDPAMVTMPGSGEDATIVVWSAPSGSKFDTDPDPLYSAADGVSFDKAIGTSRPPCRATSDADGTMEVESGPYYRCTIWKTATFLPTAYKVQFRTGSTISTLNGTLQRP